MVVGEAAGPARPCPGGPRPPWSPAGTMATSPAPRRRSCSPGPARTAASSCAPASPSPGPTRSACCEYNARPRQCPPSARPGLPCPGEQRCSGAAQRGETSWGLSQGPALSRGLYGMAWSGPACTLPGFVGARRGLRCHRCARSSGLAVLDPSRATPRPGHTPQLPGWAASSGLQGQEKGCRLCEVGGSSGLQGGGCVRARSAQGLLADARCGNVRENRCGEAALPCPGSRPLEKTVIGGTTSMGWVHSRKDFQFTQTWHLGPCAQRKSPSQAATASFLLVSALGCVPSRWGLSAARTSRSTTLDVAEWASCPNN